MEMIEVKHMMDLLFHNPYIVVLGAVTLIQVAPIKIDPWTRLFKWIGSIINGEVSRELQEVKHDLHELKREVECDKTSTARWNILHFANTCRHGKRHSKEEWEHVIDEIYKYDAYVEEKNIENGVFEEDAKYLKSLYQEISEKNDFLL